MNAIRNQQNDMEINPPKPPKQKQTKKREKQKHFLKMNDKGGMNKL